MRRQRYNNNTITVTVVMAYLEADSINLLGITCTLGIHGRDGDEVVLARRETAHMEPRCRLLQCGQQCLRRGGVYPRYKVLWQPPVAARRTAHL